MGEVYRARDTKLGREVAIKVVLDDFAADPERIARFQREAQILATLNHPNIGAIYGLEQAEGGHFLVLELVEGETLAERLLRGPLALEVVLQIALQIAAALEAAHEKGVVHRDLKPANVKTTPDEQVKVLDFGLAKAMEPSGVASNVSPTAAGLSRSPTLSVMATQAGMILGTAAYMSPEQAKGLPADHRSDVFSFGVVFYEMLTGRQPFRGETAPDILASVLVREADLNVLPANLNPRLHDLIKRCLDKNPKRRWQAVGDLRAEIETIAAAPRTSAPVPVIAPPRPLWHRAMPFAATAVLAGALIGAVAWKLRPFTPTVPTAVTRFPMTLGDGQVFPGLRSVLAVSPDGSSIAYVANNQLYLRSMAELEARPISGTQESQSPANPVFSPDGRSIAFYAGAAGLPGILKSISVSGGAAATICPAGSVLGMSWGADGILFGEGSQGIFRVSPRGGQPEQLVSVNNDEMAHGPQMLPGGQAVLFTLATGTRPDRWDKAKTVVQSLTSGTRKVVVDGASDARYLPTGHIVYAVGGTLFAVPFDLRRLEVTGVAVPVVEGVRRTIGGAGIFTAATGAAQYSVSDNGSLFYVPGPVSATYLNLSTDLALMDRKGAVEGLKFPVGTYQYPRVSPDGRRIAFGTDDGKESIVWVYDLPGTSSMRRLTFGGKNRFPIWSSDGQHVAFQSDRDGDLGIFWQPADGTGTAERLTKPDSETSHVPESWLPQGDRFLFSVTQRETVSLWTYSLREKKAEPFGGVQSANPTNAAFSPDGRWVAYATAMTPRNAVDSAIYVQPFPATGATYQVSKNGDQGHDPLWSRDGKELFYVPLPNQFAVVTMTTLPTVGFSNPVPVERRFGGAGPTTPRPFDITPDGRIIAPLDTSQTQAGTQIQVVLNWFEELKQRAPAAR